MKKFLRDLVFIALLIALGYLGWRTVELSRQASDLRDTVAQLEKERREAEQQQQSPAAAEIKPEASAAIRSQIEQSTSDLRGLAFKSPVNYKMIDRVELRGFLIKRLKEQYTDQEMRDYGRSLAAFGLIPDGMDLMATVVGMYDEQVGAFYVPEERSLYTFKDLSWSGGLDKMLLSHELTHVLQDQNFDLTTFAMRVKNDDDLALATTALIEGDATLLMTRFYAENVDPTHMLSDLTAMLGQNTAKLAQAPPYLRELLLFPYQQGQQFASALFSAGGTDALNDAFRHPPTTTQQILHPDKFLHDRHDPQPVPVPSIDSPDWRLIGNNVLGEFGIRSVLEQPLGLFEAQQIAQGWVADHYHVYEHGPGGPTGLMWTTVWDSEPDAAAFQDGYRNATRKAGVTVKLHQDGKQVSIQQSADPAFFPLAEAALAH
jgi:hypothetical protein